MPNRSKKRSRKHVLSNAKNPTTLPTEDAAQSLMKTSLPELLVETHSHELSAEVPSTSQNTSEKTNTLLEPDELIKINEKVNTHLNKYFHSKSEMVVNRRVLEEMISETVGQFFSTEDTFKNINEAKHLKEKCKELQTQQIKLNRKRYALEQMIENSKYVIRLMIGEQYSYNHGILRKMPPILHGTTKKQVRSVGLQVCLTGWPFVRKPIVTYITSITNQYTESILSPEELCIVKKEAPSGSRSQIITRSMSSRNTKECTNSRALPKKETPSCSKSQMITRSMSSRNAKECTNSRVLPKKETPSCSKSQVITRSRSSRNTKECTNIRALPKKETPSESKSQMITRSRSSRNTKECTNIRALPKKETPSESKSQMNTRSMFSREKNKEEVLSVQQKSPVKNSLKEFNKNTQNLKQIDEVGFDVNISEDGVVEIIEISEDEAVEIIEISDDESIEMMEITEDETIEETITEMIKVLNISDKKEVGVQVNANINTNDNSSSTSNEASLNLGAKQLSKMPSPEAINERYLKSLSTSRIADSEKISFCQLPKYPLSPEYPPNVSKPPAPILCVKKNSNNKKQGIMVTWSFACKIPENIIEYQLFCYQERNGENIWQKIADIKSLPLPMICCLTQVVEDENYYFIVRAVDNQKLLGDFSIPACIKLQKLDPSLNIPDETIFKDPSSK